MKFFLYSFSLIFLSACSSANKLSEKDLVFDEAYYQVYVGGTEGAGANLVYYFQTQIDGALLDSLKVDGLPTQQFESTGPKAFSVTTELMEMAELDALNPGKLTLFYHRADRSFRMAIDSLTEKETVFMPSAGGGEAPQ